jgi:hypothetical protein
MTASLFQNLIEIYLKMLLDHSSRWCRKYRSDDPSSKAFNSNAIDNPAMKIAAMHHSLNLLKDLK